MLSQFNDLTAIARASLAALVATNSCPPATIPTVIDTSLSDVELSAKLRNSVLRTTVSGAVKFYFVHGDGLVYKSTGSGQPKMSVSDKWGGPGRASALALALGGGGARACAGRGGGPAHAAARAAPSARPPWPPVVLAARTASPAAAAR